MSDALFDLNDFSETREPGVRPVCSICGAHGDVIYPDGIAVRDFYAATQWALVALAEHERAAHARGTDITV